MVETGMSTDRRFKMIDLNNGETGMLDNMTARFRQAVGGGDDKRV